MADFLFSRFFDKSRKRVDESAGVLEKVKNPGSTDRGKINKFPRSVLPGLTKKGQKWPKRDFFETELSKRGQKCHFFHSGSQKAKYVQGLTSD